MKPVYYFAQWLVNDIKKDWLAAWPQRKRTLVLFGRAAKTLLQLVSWILLIIGIAFIMLNASLGVTNDWFAVLKLVSGVALLNGIVYLNDKLDEFRKEQECLLQRLKD